VCATDCVQCDAEAAWAPPWTRDNPHDAAWAIVYLVCGMWEAPDRGGLVPTRDVVRSALAELYDRHDEATLRLALRLVADQPLPHGVTPAGQQACADIVDQLAKLRKSAA